MNKIEIYNEDCITGAKKIKDNSVDLIINDAPFGISETKFNALYNRDNKNIMNGYTEAPENYDQFVLDWLTEAVRILKPNGSMYLVSGYSNLFSYFKAIEKLNLHVINHIIWKYNFGVYTKNKYVSSHYHILFVSKSKKSKITFNNSCRFLSTDKDENNGSKLYQDMEDVWCIKKEYQRGILKNTNKLPNKLVEKMILYSSYRVLRFLFLNLYPFRFQKSVHSMLCF